MIRELSYTKKCYCLAGLFFLFLVSSYVFSISDTISLANEITAKEKKLTWLENESANLPDIRKKMEEFEKTYSRQDKNSARESLVGFISRFAEKNDCLVTEIPFSSSFSKNNLSVETNTFTIKGNFHNLLLLLFKLEEDQQLLIKVVSARFFSVREMQNRSKQLYLNILTQSFGTAASK